MLRLLPARHLLRPFSTAVPRSSPSSTPPRRPPTQKPVAPAPPSPPKETTQSTPFEPIVNDLKNPDGPAVVSSSSSIPAEPEPEAFDRSSLPSLDLDPTLSLPTLSDSQSSSSSSSSSSTGRTGARARADKPTSSIDKRWRSMEKLLLGGALVGLGVGLWRLGEEEEGVKELGEAGKGEGDGLGGRLERTKKNFYEMLDYLNKPAFPTLLPPPLPAPHQRPYTLLVDLEGLLVHSSWDRATGWRTAKRPGVDYFLAYLSQFYEIVLFTSQPLYTAMPVAEKLDPFQAYLPYKLYRESTRYVNGKIVKDLQYLNRPLDKVILLDTNPEHTAAQPENAIVIKPWEGGQEGKGGLVEMIPFLESIGIFQPPDVRPVLKAYEGKDIPTEYAKVEAAQKAAAIAAWEKEHGTAGTAAAGGAGGGLGWLGKAFSGIGGTTVPRQTQPMTYLESKRAQAQKIYQEEQEYWAKNADEIRRLMEEDRQKQMAEQKGSLMGWMAGGGPKPADEQPAK